MRPMVLLLRLFFNRFGFHGQSRDMIERMIEDYRRGIAKAFGIPEEWVREDVAEKWALKFMLAFIKPEYQEKFLRKVGMLE